MNPHTVTFLNELIGAVRNPQNNRWIVRSYVTWNFTNDSGEETIVHADLHFVTLEEAMRAGVEFAIEWIEMIPWII